MPIAILVLDGSLSGARRAFSFWHTVDDAYILSPALAKILPPSGVVYSPRRHAFLASSLGVVVRHAFRGIDRLLRVRLQRQVRLVRLLPGASWDVQPLYDCHQETLARVDWQTGYCGRCHLERREETRVIRSRAIPDLRINYIHCCYFTSQHGNPSYKISQNNKIWLAQWYRS